MATDLSSELERIAASISLPDEIAEEAILEYEQIGEWLAATDSPLNWYSPEIYPQGSFRIGTAIRPLSGDDFDIDLVCRLELRKEQITQKGLKDVVGARLRAKADLLGRIKERRRCWTLTYGRRFHLDVLPCIPDLDGVQSAILLTDRQLTRWQFSNPKGYADWFAQRAGTPFMDARIRLAAEAETDVEEVPAWRIRSPLQRIVQLLKRHRDLAFQQDTDHCPPSILITTLAGRAYEGQTNLHSGLASVVSRMPEFVENRNGRWWVANPAHPSENFADKWAEKPALRTKFLEWLERLWWELSQSSTSPSPAFAVASAFHASQPTVALAASVPALGAITHVQSPQWPLALRDRCSVTGSVHMKERGKRLWPLSSRPVPKGVALRFKASTNAKPPYEIKWQVANTGAEAAISGDLRGGFYGGEGAAGAVHWESTKFGGTHWIEAFVIKDGVCVARSGRKYVPIKT